MPRIPYIQKTFSEAHQEVLMKANEILAAYETQGYDLTLRQLYYQFVARDLIPNTQQSYKRLGKIINDGRLAGEVDWNHIVDRTRNLESNSHWDEPADIVRACADQFRYDLWEDQPHRIEVWIEKDALLGVIERPCQDLDVGWFSCRGYTSQSEMWRAAMRLNKYVVNEGQEPIIIHLGDHDPSGLDMTRDMQDRLELFGCPAKIHRVALNWEQITLYNPPPNPAKLSDSRAIDYISQHGPDSWELDALEPQVITELIREEVDRLRDPGLWQAALGRQREARQVLGQISDQWGDVVDYFTNGGLDQIE